MQEGVKTLLCTHMSSFFFFFLCALLNLVTSRPCSAFHFHLKWLVQWTHPVQGLTDLSSCIFSHTIRSKVCSVFQRLFWLITHSYAPFCPTRCFSCIFLLDRRLPLGGDLSLCCPVLFPFPFLHTPSLSLCDLYFSDTWIQFCMHVAPPPLLWRPSFNWNQVKLAFSQYTSSMITHPKFCPASPP